MRPDEGFRNWKHDYPIRRLHSMIGCRIAAMILVAASYSTGAWGQTNGRTISFSGYTWAVKASTGRVGPGPNYFSDSTNNVWVDTQGRLHLKITKVGGRWNCAEVINQQSLG